MLTRKNIEKSIHILIFILIFIVLVGIRYYYTMSECNRDSTFLVGRYSRRPVSCDYKYQYIFGYALIILITLSAILFL